MQYILCKTVILLQFQVSFSSTVGHVPVLCAFGAKIKVAYIILSVRIGWERLYTPGILVFTIIPLWSSTIEPLKHFVMQYKQQKKRIIIAGARPTIMRVRICLFYFCNLINVVYGCSLKFICCCIIVSNFDSGHHLLRDIYWHAPIKVLV